MVCLQCTFVVSQAHWTFYRYNLSLNVVFLFQSFLVITVTAIYIFNSNIQHEFKQGTKELTYKYISWVYRTISNIFGLVS